MKVPLRYQITEYDCGPVSFLNAISFLFDREEIDPELIKVVHQYTLDGQDKFGNIGKGGTTRSAIEKLSKYLNDNIDKYKILCKPLEKVNIETINECLNNRGCALYRTYIEKYEHYVIITKIENEKIYLFDPYYLETNTYSETNNFQIVLNSLFSYNRIITEKKFLDEKENDFSLGPIEKRQCVLLYRIR